MEALAKGCRRCMEGLEEDPEALEEDPDGPEERFIMDMNANANQDSQALIVRKVI